MKVGLYFGSFNPIHFGHLIVAQHIIDFSDLEEVWFVISPHNPFKNAADLLPVNNRLAMLQIATENYSKFKVCDIELALPKPSYTVHTILELKNRYSNYDFNLILGSDNLDKLNDWKEINYIFEHIPLHIYTRPNFDINTLNLPKSSVLYNGPNIYISATYIRQLLKSGKSASFLTPNKVISYLKENKLIL